MEKKKECCSLVVPCYNEEQALPYFYREAKKVMEELKEELEFELVFVDDGSGDKTREALDHLCDEDSRVHYLSFSRNFGKEAALYAGLCRAGGDYVVTLDADLQDPPSLIPGMYRMIKEEGCDCIATRRATRKGEPLLRSLFARGFYKLMNKISKTGVVDGARDFRFMKRQMVDAVLSMGEYNRFSKGIFEWVGFETKYVSYENVERVAGDTKWSFFKLFKYSVEGIVAFSTVPLALVSLGGMVLCGIAFVMVVYLVIRALLYGDAVSGWPSLACIIIFLGGLQLFSSGILGIYLSKTYLESKERPIYIVKEER